MLALRMEIVVIKSPVVLSRPLGLFKYLTVSINVSSSSTFLSPTQLT